VVGGVEAGEHIDAVGAQGRVNVGYLEIATAGPIDRPASELTYYSTLTCETSKLQPREHGVCHNSYLMPRVEPEERSSAREMIKIDDLSSSFFIFLKRGGGARLYFCECVCDAAASENTDVSTI